jgi:arsenate reductase-like glutaredoxin family protein
MSNVTKRNKPILKKRLLEKRRTVYLRLRPGENTTRPGSEFPGGKMQKRAQFFYRNPCTICDETKSFLEDHGVTVMARDINEKPLRRDELVSILGYLDPRHYLDMTSAAYRKQKLDKQMPSQGELFELIESNPELLRHPIIMAGRLVTIGSNQKQLIEMFQLSVSGNGSGKDGPKATEGAA